MFEKASCVKVILTVLLFSLVSSSCVLSNDEKFGDIPDFHKQLGPPTDYPEANAVIIFDKSNIFVKQRI